VVNFNATNQPLMFTDTSLADLRMHLHPTQRHSSDTLTRQSTFNSKTGSATVAALTTAVFVREER
jgi:pullulanase